MNEVEWVDVHRDRRTHVRFWRKGPEHGYYVDVYRDDGEMTSMRPFKSLSEAREYARLQYAERAVPEALR